MSHEHEHEHEHEPEPAPHFEAGLAVRLGNIVAGGYERFLHLWVVSHGIDPNAPTDAVQAPVNPQLGRLRRFVMKRIVCGGTYEEQEEAITVKYRHKVFDKYDRTLLRPRGNLTVDDITSREYDIR